jgi:glucosamine 6-phosphate synthetase-like amidotransferase/phosphosugar isomerase protein
MPVVAIAPNDVLLEKLKSNNLREVRARGGGLYVAAESSKVRQAPRQPSAVVGRQSRDPPARERVAVVVGAAHGPAA